MCQKESWGAIVATREAHSTQRGQPPRMHGPGLWRYEQREQRVTPVPMSGVNFDQYQFQLTDWSLNALKPVTRKFIWNKLVIG